MVTSQVHTCIRIRPAYPPSDDALLQLNIDMNNTRLQISKEIPMMSSTEVTKSETSYNFDRIFDPQKSNMEVFLQTWPILRDNLLRGFNGAFCVYGQTGSGKTYTVDAYLNELIPILFSDLQESGFETDISLSYVQLYLDGIYDLFEQNKQIIGSKYQLTNVASLPSIPVQSSHYTQSLLYRARKYRKLSEHALNRRSSRSHTIFIIQVTLRKGDETFWKPKLYIVDLAGSERLSRTMSEGIGLDEGCNINKSLSCLAKCLECMAQRQSLIPFRESILTSFLKDAMCNSLFVLLCCISPETLDEDETRSTLQFATVARKVIIHRQSTLEQAKRRSLRKKYEARFDQKIADLEVKHQGELYAMRNRVISVKNSAITHLKNYEGLHIRYRTLKHKLEQKEKENLELRVKIEAYAEDQQNLRQEQKEPPQTHTRSILEEADHKSPQKDSMLDVLQQRISVLLIRFRDDLLSRASHSAWQLSRESLTRTESCLSQQYSVLFSCRPRKEKAWVLTTTHPLPFVSMPETTKINKAEDVCNLVHGRRHQLMLKTEKLFDLRTNVTKTVQVNRSPSYTELYRLWGQEMHSRNNILQNERDILSILQFMHVDIVSKLFVLELVEQHVLMRDQRALKNLVPASKQLQSSSLKALFHEFNQESKRHRSEKGSSSR